MSPASFLVAAIAAYVVAISVGIALYLVVRDSVEDLRGKLRWALAECYRTISRKSALLGRLRPGPSYRSPVATVGAELRRQRRLWHVRLVGVRASCGSASARLAMEAREQGLLLSGRLLYARRSGEAAMAGCVAELQRQRLLVFARLVRVRRSCQSAVVWLGVELRRRLLLLCGRLVRLQRSSRSASARFRAELGRQRLLAGVALAGAAASAVVATHDFGSRGKSGGRASSTLGSAGRIVEWSHTPRSFSNRLAAAPDRPLTPKRKTLPAARSTHGPHTTLVSDTLPGASTSTAPTASGTFVATASQADGPAPLPAPPGASAPSPLRAP
jgi:hypothetical protein